MIFSYNLKKIFDVFVRLLHCMTKETWLGPAKRGGATYLNCGLRISLMSISSFIDSKSTRDQNEKKYN